MLFSDWPYCNAAKRFSSVLMTKTDWSTWNDFQWRRRIETFGDDDRPVLAAGPNGTVDTVWYGKLMIAVQDCLVPC